MPGASTIRMRGNESSARDRGVFFGTVPRNVGRLRVGVVCVCTEAACVAAEIHVVILFTASTSELHVHVNYMYM